MSIVYSILLYLAENVKGTKLKFLMTFSSGAQKRIETELFGKFWKFKICRDIKIKKNILSHHHLSKISYGIIVDIETRKIFFYSKKLYLYPKKKNLLQIEPKNNNNNFLFFHILVATIHELIKDT